MDPVKQTGQNSEGDLSKALHSQKVGIAYRDLFAGVRRKAKDGDQYPLVDKGIGQTTTQIP